MAEFEWAIVAQHAALLVCLVATGCIGVVGLIYLNDRSRHVEAPSREQAHDALAARSQARARHAAATLHELPARGDRGNALAARAHPGRDGRWAYDVRELRPRALVVPVVSEAVQPVGGREARRAGAAAAASSAASRGVRHLGMVTLEDVAAAARSA